MQEAHTDITYCVKECSNKCWRHESNYRFREDRLYSYTNECIEK